MAGTIAPLSRLGSLFEGPRATSPEAIKRRRQIAEQLQAQAMSGQDSGSMLGAIAKGIQGFAGGAMAAQDRRAEAEAQQKRAALYAQVLAGGGEDAAPAMGAGALPTPAGMRPAPTSGMTRDRGGVPANIPSFVASAGQPYGISPTYMTTVADIESRGNPNAKNPSGASGLFQFMPGTARQYGLSNPFDPAASADAAARLASDNRGILRRTLGRDPTEGELYLAHQQGAGGAGKLLANPNALAADLVGRAAVVQNGGRANMSAAEFSGLWTGKYDQRAGRQAAADMPAAGGQPVSFLTEPRDPNGGFFIPPGVRAQAPAGDPSGLRPEEMPPQQIPAPVPPPVSPDVAALTSPEPMGPAQSFVPPASIPLPPARPPAGDLVAQQPTMPAPEPPPAAVAQAPEPQSVPLPPARPSDAALYAQPAADMPAPGAVPATGMAPPINPNAQDAGAGAFARRQGVDAMLGGLQDGLDRIFGGPETQARLDRQVAALGGAPQPSARALQQAAILDPAGAPQQAPAAAPPLAATPPAGTPPPQGPAQAGPAPAGTGGRGGPQVQALMGILNDPYASPGDHQFALAQLGKQLDNSVTNVDLGDAVGIMDKRGNLIGQIPKQKTSVVGEGGSLVDNRGNVLYNGGSKLQSVPAGNTLFDPMTRQPVFQAPQASESYTLSPGQQRFQGGQPVASVPGGQPEGFDTESKLRGEFNGRTKDYAAVHDAYGRVLSAVAPREGGSTDRSPASDIALVYGYMKMLDPGSVVREGEFATAQNAGSIPERIVNVYNKAVKGEFLTPEQRQDMVNGANRLYAQTRKGVEGEAERYRGLSKDYSVNPDRVVRLPDALTAPNLLPPAAAPQIRGPAPASGQPAPQQPAPAQAAPVAIQSPDQLQRLQPGTLYQAPDGSIRRKR